MLLIFSKEIEVSTDRLIEWLLHWKKPFVRVNMETALDILSVFSISSRHSTIKFLAEGIEYDLDDFDSVWFRRGFFRFGLKADFDSIKPSNLGHETLAHLRREYTTLVDFLSYKLRKKHCLNFPATYNYNKLIALDMAKLVGLKIPPTFIVTRKNELQELAAKHQLITKCIQDVLSVNMGNYNVGHSTKTVTDAFITELAETFPESLFQEAIEKRYELRVFYINRKCFAAAIFSQLDQQTAVDYRNYNHERPNRVVPYTLPERVEKQIRAFMKLADLESGSLDVIVTPKGEYVFLEVNPVGQYDNISMLCNYHLNKEVAQYLVA